jgi:branched-chain amino acid transport system permease protein
MKTMSSSTRGLIILAAVMAALPLVLPNSFYMDVAIRIAINAIVVIALNLLMGYTGQISLGHAGFFGIGAYASALLTTRFNIPSILALVAGALVTGLLAFLVARPILRLKGHTLAMATLGLGIILSIVITNEVAYTGGPDGMSVPGFAIGAWSIEGDKAWYAVVSVLLLLVTWCSLNLINSPVGRALQAIHGSEIAARVAGVDTVRYKVKVFVLSAVVASLAGSISAHYVGFVTPGIASFFHSIELVTMVVVGGMASVFGSIVGAALLTVLPQLLSQFEGWETVVYGVILAVSMIFLPRGLVPTLAARMRRSGPMPATVVAPVAATVPALQLKAGSK